MGTEGVQGGILLLNIMNIVVRMTTLLHRTMVRCSETSHASLLLPVLTIMKTIVVLAEERDVASLTSQMFQKLAHNLCKKLLISSDALRRSNSGKT